MCVYTVSADVFDLSENCMWARVEIILVLQNSRNKLTTRLEVRITRLLHPPHWSNSALLTCTCNVYVCLLSDGALGWHGDVISLNTSTPLMSRLMKEQDKPIKEKRSELRSCWKHECQFSSGSEASVAGGRFVCIKFCLSKYQPIS